MASTLVSYFGDHADCFATLGFVAVSYVALKFLCSLWRGLKTYFLAKSLGLSTNLKRLGAWSVVTGATDGIGKAYAFELARQGINVVLVSRTPEKLADVAKEIVTKYKVETKVVAIDFTGGQEIYEKLAKELSGMDIGVLVNNVGVSYDYPQYYGEIKDDKVIRNMINVNINSVAMTTRIVLPAMEEKRKGAIINISSGSATIPSPLLTTYAATKSFVDHFSRCLQVEYQSKGLIIQVVLPFFVSTKLSKIRRSSMFVPTPTAYVRSALATVGVETETHGYWSHALQGYVQSRIPISLLSTISLKMMTGARKAALKKMQKAQ